MRKFGMTALVFVGALGLALGCGTESRGGGGGGAGGGGAGAGAGGGGNNGGGDAGGGANGGGDDGGGGGDARTGETVCSVEGMPEVKCQAGQYCADQTLADCQNGCLNDNNCASNQHCDLDGGSPGTCMNNEANPDPGGAVSKEDFCNKVVACGAPQAQCEAMYDATNATCHACIVGANCADENACQAECGMGGGDDGMGGDDGGDGGGCPDHMGEDCAALCQGGLTCADNNGNGICTKQCGNDLDCTDYSDCGGIGTWVCDEDQGACVPF